VGVLLIHGYTGSVVEVRPMGEYLAEQGLTVRCPLLPGHGTNPQELTQIRWQEWGNRVETELDSLRERCGTVFVGGLSLGSLLTLWLGSRYPEIAGLVVMAPAMKFQNRLAPLALGLRYLLKYDPFRSLGDEDLVDPEGIERNWCYDELPWWGLGEVFLLRRLVIKSLPLVRQPLLIFQGRRDAKLTPGAPQTVYEGVASTDKTVVWLEHSGHNLLIDGEREAVWAQSYAWMMARAES
jgi:carboxylesterase